MPSDAELVRELVDLIKNLDLPPLDLDQVMAKLTRPSQLMVLAERCSHELHGYRVPVEPGTELEVIARRLDELDRCCASYSRSLAKLKQES